MRERQQGVSVHGGFPNPAADMLMAGKIVRTQSTPDRAKTVLSEGGVSVDTSSEEKAFAAGQVSAGGGGALADISTSLQTLDFNQLLVRHAASTYMFRVQGSEWEDAGVFDGDIAVVDRALDARKTDAVLWWDEQKGEFAISKRAQMPDSAVIWGVITATIHQFRKKQIHASLG